MHVHLLFTQFLIRHSQGMSPFEVVIKHIQIKVYLYICEYICVYTYTQKDTIYQDRHCLSVWIYSVLLFLKNYILGSQPF